MTTMHGFQVVEMYAGDDFEIPITVANISDLAGSTIVFGIASYVYKSFSGPTLVSKTSAAGDITTASNIATVTLQKADTQSLDGLFYAELEITDAAGNEGTAEPFILQIHPTLID